MSNVLQDTGGNTLKVHGGGVFGSAAAAAVVPTGNLRFTASRYTATTTGNIAIQVERYGGDTGILSATITQSDANRASGKYVSQPLAVSFANGEYGIKSYNFNVSTAPSDGPYWINLALSVASPRHWWDINSEVEVNDGVSVPVSDTANVYEVGPSGDWTTLVAATRAVTSPALVLIRGGNYSNEDYLGDSKGINPQYSGTRANRIIYMAYPTETPVIIADTTATDLTVDFPSQTAIWLRPLRAVGSLPLKGLVFKGLTIKQCGNGIYAEGGSGYNEDIIVEDCTIYDCGTPAGNNVGGVYLNATRYSAVRNCNIHHIYEDNSLHLDVHDNNACIHGYKSADIVIEDNTFANAAHLVYHKNPHLVDDGQTGYVIRRNLLNECYTAIRMEDHYVGRAAPYIFDKVDIYHNISTLSPLFTERVQRTFYSSQGLHIYQNNCAVTLGSLGGFVGTEVYNNIYEGTSFAWQKQDDWVTVGDNPYSLTDGSGWPTVDDADSTKVHEIGTLTYCDYNIYNTLSITLAQYSTADATTYTTLSGWQAATDADIMPVAIAGANSVVMDPLLNAGFRATATLAAGRFGADIGVPDSVVVGGTT